MSILLLDVGNTRTTVALASGTRIHALQTTPTGSRRAVTDARAIIRGYQSKHTLEQAVLSSVVPDATDLWARELGRARLAFHTLTHRSNIGLTISYPNPATIGADRLANACAGVAAHGAPLIVADFGTALTFDIVNRDQTYVGGVIAPGLPLMTDYLSEKTALLPHIALKGRCGRVGRSTVGAMRIGAQVGYRGIVREIVTHLCEDRGLKGAALCATGGYAGWALKGAGMPFHIDPLLTLRGLARVAALNT